MQTVSSTFTTNTSAASQYVDYGLLIAWTEQINPSYAFFTIGTSTIGGPDFIPGTGSVATFLDRYQYTDYSSYALSLDISRNIGQYPYGTIMAQCEVKLDNTSFLFMPGYDATIGAYILPNRPLKLSTGFSGELINMFSGYSTAPRNDVNNRETILSGYDGMNYLNLFPSQGAGTIAAANGGAYINQYAHTIIADLLGEAGFSSSQYVIEQSLQKPIGYLSPRNFQGGTNVNGNPGSIGYIIAALCEAESAIAFFDENGVFHFWNRQHIPNNTASQWTFDYTKIINYAIENTPVINDIVVRANPRVVQAKQNIWQLTTPVLIPAGSTAIITADFADENGALPATSVDTPAYYTGATSSSYATNLNSDGSSTVDVHSYISVTGTSLIGSSYQMTFQNTYTQPIYITSLSLNGTPAKVTQFINQEFKNQTSINLYGINPANNGQPLVIENDLIQDNDTAHSIAYQLVTDYNAPLQRMQLEVMAVPQLQFGDYVTVTLNDVSQTKSYTVVGVAFSQTRDDPLRQIVEVEVKQMVTYFTIGTSHIGGTDQIAP